MSNHQWYPLNDFPCPGAVCKGKGTGVNWVCGKCKTQMYISQRGYLSCYDKTHFGKVSEYPWNCGIHLDDPYTKNKVADIQSFSYALSQTVTLMAKAGPEWVRALVEELGRQYK